MLGVLIVLGLAPGFQNVPSAAAECPPAATPMVSDDLRASPVSSPEALTSDLAIIDSMLQQHARSMALANQGLRFGQNAQVRRMALRIAEGHAGEIQLLRSLRTTWYPEAPDLVAPSVADFDQIGMNCSGPSFDRAFLLQLQIELQAEVDGARTAETRAEHPELQSFAQTILDARGSEMRTIDELLATL